MNSRKCESCVENGERPPFLGIEYDYEGDAAYDESVASVGCGWYNPQAWRASLHAELDG